MARVMATSVIRTAGILVKEAAVKTILLFLNVLRMLSPANVNVATGIGTKESGLKDLGASFSSSFLLNEPKSI